LLLDEPTNHLDISSKEILEDALRGFDGTLLFISHDRYFINGIATKVFEMDGLSVNTYLGDYDYYVNKKYLIDKEKAESVTDQVRPGTEGKNEWQLKKEKDAALRKQKNRKKRLENDIADTEAQIDSFLEQLNDPEIAHDYEKAAELYKNKEEAEAKLLSLYEEYEEYEEQEE